MIFGRAFVQVFVLHNDQQSVSQKLLDFSTPLLRTFALVLRRRQQLLRKVTVVWLVISFQVLLELLELLAENLAFFISTFVDDVELVHLRHDLEVGRQIFRDTIQGHMKPIP